MSEDAILRATRRRRERGWGGRGGGGLSFTAKALRRGRERMKGVHVCRKHHATVTLRSLYE